MKCLLVVDRMNDVLFADFNDAFAKHVNQEAVNSGLIQPEEMLGDPYYVDSNIVMQLFSPLVLSQWFLIEETHNPCSSITCQNGFLFVFQQLDDLLFIAINGDKTETENKLQRKILIFHRLVGFLFGPVTDEIGRSRYEDKKERWNFLRRLLDTWSTLYEEEQPFMVEAIERLVVNQGVSEASIGLLETAVQKMDAVSDRPTQHALLLVNSKLLALYTNRNAPELRACDTLCITLLVRDLFPGGERLEDLFSQSYASSHSHPPHHSSSYVPSTAKQLPHSHTEEDSDQEYHSAPTSPVGEDSTNNARREEEATEGEESDLTAVESERELPAAGASQSSMDLPIPDSVSPSPAACDLYDSQAASSPLKPSPVPKQSTSPQFQEAEAVGGGQEGAAGGSKGVREAERSFNFSPSDSLSQPDPSISSVSESSSGPQTASKQSSLQTSSQARPEGSPDYWRQTIFLQTPRCQYSPHQLHCTQIKPGTVLVLLTQGHRQSLAEPLCRLFLYVRDLLGGSRSMELHGGSFSPDTYDIMHGHFSRVRSLLKRSSGRVETILLDMRKHWENETTKTALMKFLGNLTAENFSTRLETALSELYRRLKELFSLLYLSPRAANDAVRSKVKQLQGLAQMRLHDFSDFLSVKAVRNVTMTSYLNDFPGLQHFIYINRQSNEVTAPSLNIAEEMEAAKDDATNVLKAKVWRLHEVMMEQLSRGITAAMVTEDDSRYSYFLWFEDSRGYAMAPQEPLNPAVLPPLPGILTGKYYRRLLQTCFPRAVPGSVHCYELYMLHAATIRPEVVSEQGERLARHLWEMSIDAITTISLL